MTQTLVNDSPWLTPTEAAKYLHLRNVRAVYRMIEDGRLPAYRLGTKVLRLHRDDIDAALGRSA